MNSFRAVIAAWLNVSQTGMERVKCREGFERCDELDTTLCNTRAYNIGLPLHFLFNTVQHNIIFLNKLT